ncbi:MAG: SURF1 family protein [Rhodoluna sp.]
MMMKNSGSVKRYASWFFLGAIFALGCWFLSQWQFSRQAEVSAANQLINRNYDQPAVSLTSLLTPAKQWDKNLEFRLVSVTGRYIPSSSLLVRNRPYDGQPGFLQLVAFRTDSGSAIWVERGWYPTGNNQDAPDWVAKVDANQRSLLLRLRHTENPDSREAPTGQLQNIDLVKASATLGGSAYRQAYGRLVEESTTLQRGVDLGRPQLSEGNHLSYALQWILFALMAIGAVLWNISQDRRRIAGLPPRKLKILSRDRDAEVEDEILK